MKRGNGSAGTLEPVVHSKPHTKAQGTNVSFISVFSVTKAGTADLTASKVWNLP